MLNEKTTCKQHECRDVFDQICENVKDCPWWNLACHVKRWVCHPVKKVVCDDACKIWNHEIREKINTVYTAGDCASKGMVEAVKNFKCLKHLDLPKCAETAFCYVSELEPVDTYLNCTSGILFPSNHCLRQAGFIN